MQTLINGLKRFDKARDTSTNTVRRISDRPINYTGSSRKNFRGQGLLILLR